MSETRGEYVTARDLRRIRAEDRALDELIDAGRTRGMVSTSTLVNALRALRRHENAGVENERRHTRGNAR